MCSNEVPQQVMNNIYEEVKTPYKYGLVVVPENDSFKVDCPTVFRRNDSWYMSYIVFDGRGYETWLAKSDDLLNWQTLDGILSFNTDTTKWDASQKAGYMSLVDTKWGGDYSVAQTGAVYSFRNNIFQPRDNSPKISPRKGGIVSTARRTISLNMGAKDLGSNPE